MARILISRHLVLPLSSLPDRPRPGRGVSSAFRFVRSQMAARFRSSAEGSLPPATGTCPAGGAGSRRAPPPDKEAQMTESCKRKVSYIGAAVIGCALLVGAGTPPAHAIIIPAGDDSFNSDPAGTFADIPGIGVVHFTSNPGVSFSGISIPFSITLQTVGAPWTSSGSTFAPCSNPVGPGICLHTAPMHMHTIFPTPTGGTPDTRVNRLQAANLPDVGDQDTVPIEIVALSLQSVSPVQIGSSFFDVFVELSGPQDEGSMTLFRTDPDGVAGGVFDSTLPVNGLFTLQLVSEPATLLLLGTGLAALLAFKKTVSNH